MPRAQRPTPATRPPRAPLAPRVAKLEEKVTLLAEGHEELSERQTRLEKLALQLRQDQRETRKIVASLREAVEGIPATVKRHLDGQTSDIRVIVAESETRNADRITNVARQAPAWTLVFLTLLGTGLVSVVVDLLLAAGHLPHFQ